MMKTFTPLACQRWSLIRMWLLLLQTAHCFRRFHCAVTIWGDHRHLMKHIRPGSWVVTYECHECNWSLAPSRGETE